MPGEGVIETNGCPVEIIGTLLVDDVDEAPPSVTDMEPAITIAAVDCDVWGAASAGNGVISLDNVKTLVPISSKAMMI